MTDQSTTLFALKRAIIDLCRRKGWGVDGIQHPQHIAMAMMVEVCEVLEHFMDMTEDQARALQTGGMAGKRAEIAEEMADVLMYGLQIMHTLDFDVSAALGEDCSDQATPVAALKARAGLGDTDPIRRAMHVVFCAGGMLERFQFLPEADVQAMVAHRLPEKRREIGCEFAKLFRQILMLANLLQIDVAAEIFRKIAIVDARTHGMDDPAR
ncbi:MAG: hypothetical protein ACOYI5_06350 [Christensenellales bacterium]